MSFSCVPIILPAHRWQKDELDKSALYINPHSTQGTWCRVRIYPARQFEAFSAGTEATAVRPLAMRAMQELGIDISRQQSKTLDRYLNDPFDEVITVCDAAAEVCPVFPGAKRRRHWSFPDPSQAVGTEEEQLAVYRAVRDAIRARIETELVGVS